METTKRARVDTPANRAAFYLLQEAGACPSWCGLIERLTLEQMLKRADESKIYWLLSRFHDGRYGLPTYKEYASIAKPASYKRLGEYRQINIGNGVDEKILELYAAIDESYHQTIRDWFHSYLPGIEAALEAEYHRLVAERLIEPCKEVQEKL